MILRGEREQRQVPSSKLKRPPCDHVPNRLFFVLNSPVGKLKRDCVCLSVNMGEPLGEPLCFFLVFTFCLVQYTSLLQTFFTFIHVNIHEQQQQEHMTQITSTRSLYHECQNHGQCGKVCLLYPPSLPVHRIPSHRTMTNDRPMD